MDLQQIAIYIGQWLVIEVSKKFPKIGTWVRNGAPAFVALLATIVTVLQGLFNPPEAGAQVSDTLGAVLASPVVVRSGIALWLSNALGAILADNLLRKIAWHWLLGKVFKVKFAQATTTGY